MRTILLVIALLIVIALALVWTGVINLNRNANGSVSIETRDVEGGTSKAKVQLPVGGREARQVDVRSVAFPDGSDAHYRPSPFRSRCARRWTRPPPPPATA